VHLSLREAGGQSAELRTVSLVLGEAGQASRFTFHSSPHARHRSDRASPAARCACRTHAQLPFPSPHFNGCRVDKAQEYLWTRPPEGRVTKDGDALEGGGAERDDVLFEKEGALSALRGRRRRSLACGVPGRRDGAFRGQQRICRAVFSMPVDASASTGSERPRHSRTSQKFTHCDLVIVRRCHHRTSTRYARRQHAAGMCRLPGADLRHTEPRPAYSA
jgi:hypothetical protein